ncbi:hypothetical protein Q8A73_019535 [Channa argus]|nr:hypothetical protein Q8A73_019535 [Channa argus]
MVNERASLPRDVATDTSQAHWTAAQALSWPLPNLHSNRSITTVSSHLQKDSAPRQEADRRA